MYNEPYNPFALPSFIPAGEDTPRYTQAIGPQGNVSLSPEAAANPIGFGLPLLAGNPANVTTPTASNGMNKFAQYAGMLAGQALSTSGLTTIAELAGRFDGPAKTRRLQQRNYDGLSDNRFAPQAMMQGNYSTNGGVGNNFRPGENYGSMGQRFEDGGEYEMSDDEYRQFLAEGGEGYALPEFTVKAKRNERGPVDPYQPMRTRGVGQLSNHQRMNRMYLENHANEKMGAVLEGLEPADSMSGIRVDDPNYATLQPRQVGRANTRLRANNMYLTNRLNTNAGLVQEGLEPLSSIIGDETYSSNYAVPQHAFAMPSFADINYSNEAYIDPMQGDQGIDGLPVKPVQIPQRTAYRKRQMANGASRRVMYEIDRMANGLEAREPSFKRGGSFSKESDRPPKNASQTAADATYTQRAISSVAIDKARAAFIQEQWQSKQTSVAATKSKTGFQQLLKDKFEANERINKRQQQVNDSPIGKLAQIPVVGEMADVALTATNAIVDGLQGESEGVINAGVAALPFVSGKAAQKLGVGKRIGKYIDQVKENIDLYNTTSVDAVQDGYGTLKHMSTIKGNMLDVLKPKPLYTLNKVDVSNAMRQIDFENRDLTKQLSKYQRMNQLAGKVRKTTGKLYENMPNDPYRIKSYYQPDDFRYTYRGVKDVDQIPESARKDIIEAEGYDPATIPKDEFYQRTFTTIPKRPYGDAFKGQGIYSANSLNVAKGYAGSTGQVATLASKGDDINSILAKGYNTVQPLQLSGDELDYMTRTTGQAFDPEHLHSIPQITSGSSKQELTYDNTLNDILRQRGYDYKLADYGSGNFHKIFINEPNLINHQSNNQTNEVIARNWTNGIDVGRMRNFTFPQDLRDQDAILREINKRNRVWVDQGAGMRQHINDKQHKISTELMQRAREKMSLLEGDNLSDPFSYPFVDDQTTKVNKYRGRDWHADIKDAGIKTSILSLATTGVGAMGYSGVNYMMMTPKEREAKEAVHKAKVAARRAERYRSKAKKD